MKYLILTNNSGGLYRFRKELMERLIRDGHKVYAATPFDEFVDEMKDMGICLICQDMNRRGINPLQELRLLKRYSQIIRQVQPDFMITYTIKPGIYGGLLAGIFKVPYAVNITGLGTAFEKTGALRFLITNLWRAALRSARCVFFENRENGKTFRDLRIVSRGKIHILHGAGVNLADFPLTEYPEEGAAIRFLFIGRVMREKGIDELLCAMERLHQKYEGAVLDVVGWCEEDYECRLEELQARGILEYHGFQRDIKPFVRRAHAFVLPSYHEGMANTLLESGAMGRPLITSNVHGCMEAVRDGQTGFLCGVRDVESLERQMERFIKLPYEQKRQMGYRSHLFVAKNFDKEKVVQETVEILYKIESR